MYCTSCGAQNRETSRFCTKCGSRLLHRQEGESIDLGPYRSVYQEYQELRHPERQDVAPPHLEASRFPLADLPPGAGVAPIEGHERSVVWSFIWSLLTCGLYGFVWLYLIGNDLRKLTRRGEPQAGLNVFLTILTCNVWGVYLAYKYPRLIDEIQPRVSLPQSHLSLVCVLLTVFGIWKVYGLGLISMALMQNELNKIWRTLRGLQP